MPKKLNKVNQPEKEKRPIPPQAVQAAEAYTAEAILRGNPLGSYTGIAQNPLEKPVQDADDL